MEPAGLQPKVIAYYDTESIVMEFKKIEGKIFVDTLTEGRSRNEYPLDPSFSKIKAVPLDLRSSSKKTIRWLLNNQYFPCIQDGRIVFHFKNNEFSPKINALEATEFSNAGISKVVIEPDMFPHISHLKHQEEFSQLFPDIQIRVELDNPDSQDIEGQYSKCLIQAKKKNFLEEQIFYLKKLSDIYIHKEDFSKGSKLLNCAIAIVALLKDNSLQFSINKYLFSQLDLIEELFLKNQGFEVPLKREKPLSHYRNSLQNIRESARLAQINQKPIQEVLNILTQAFKNILAELISEAMNQIGSPPVQWACMGMGSMSRGEMCPYSDVEFAFVIEKDTPQAMGYFRALSKILELKIINLGETKFPIFGGGCESPTPDGFCMDRAGNTPLGAPGIYELIGTPKQLAQFQDLKWINGNIILPNVMSSVCFVTGKQDLITEYIKEKATVQQTKVKQGKLQQMNEEVLAMRLLVGHLHEFRPDLSRDKEEQSEFNVKKELYRPFQEILSSLAILYHLKTQSTFDRIDELKQMKIFSIKGAENLKRAIGKAFSLRLQVQLFYKDEREDLCHLEEGKLQDTSLFYMNKEQIEFLHTIYQVLFPFHKCANDFYQTKDVNFLNNNDFFDDSPSILGKSFQKMQQINKAHEAYQNAVSLNPNDTSSLMLLARFEIVQGEDEKGLERQLKVLGLIKQKYGENHTYTAQCYNEIGQSYNCMGKYKEALKYYKKALKILEHEDPIEILERMRALLTNLKSGEDGFFDIYFESSRVYIRIGVAYSDLKQYDKALKYLERSLKLRQDIFGKNSIELIDCYLNIGLIYGHLNEYEKALESYQKTLEISLKKFGESHLQTARILVCISASYDGLKQYEKALEIQEKAFKIYLNCFGEEHVLVGTLHTALGDLFEKLGDYQNALKHYQKALKIQLKSPHTENHCTNSVSNYRHIGRVYSCLGEHKKSLEYYQKALKGQLQTNSGDHLDAASLFCNIGKVYLNLEKYQESLEFSRNALKIQLQILGEEHLDVASNYETIGMAYNMLGDSKKGLEFSLKTLETRVKILGENHLDVAKSYKAVGLKYNILGDYEKAIQCVEQALKIQLLFLDENNPQVRKTHDIISSIYASQGDIKKVISSNYDDIGFCNASLLYCLFCTCCGRKTEESEKLITNQEFKVLKSTPKQINPIQAVRKQEKQKPKLGRISHELQEEDIALAHFQNSLQHNIKLLGEIHPQIAMDYYSIANLYHDLGYLDKALKNYQQALKIRMSLITETGQHHDIASCYIHIGEIYYSLGDYNHSLTNRLRL